MNRFLKYTHVGRHGSARNMHDLAVELKPRGYAGMRLGRNCMHLLRRSLAATAVISSRGDEALRRLKADSGHIEACLRRAQMHRFGRLPASGGSARVLALVRSLVGDGEHRLGQRQIEEDIAAFDHVQNLTMRELQLVPAALDIALCEAFAGLCRDILAAARMQRRARAWVNSGGRGTLPRQMDAIFLSHALRLCTEQECGELHARVERIIDRSGRKTDHLVAQAHRSLADNCLRLENLMQLYRTLETLDWEACFERISPAEIELGEDPAGVYGRMDALSKAHIRENVAQLAQMLGLQELTVVRYALRAAQRAEKEHGAHDPRATVCWYLAEEAGRSELCAELGETRRMRRCIPDADGRYTVMIVSGVTTAVLALLLWAIGNPWLMIYALPLAWVVAAQVIGKLYSRWVKPAHLLKMKIDTVPDSARTLVVLPVLLSSETRTREMVAHMHALGCLEKDENIDYLLLGDFRDAGSEDLDDDDAILAAAREGVDALNRDAEREKYFYLHRSRSFRERDERWMGENRKRGALMALNRLLLGREGAQDAFRAEHACVDRIAGRYAYVVTLDADTEYLPGTLQKLVGTMLHPLNHACMLGNRRRGYAVLQPSMLLTAEAVANGYVQLNAGDGGVDGYPVSISDFYQDMTGRGCFAGKGIYDVRAFTMAIEGKLNDDEILSHDLIEGILAGAASLGDVHFYDGCPADMHAELVRLNRWTRGDWQLLPVLFSKMQMAAVDRMKLLGNLLRSLYAPALLGLFIHALWLDVPGAFLLALLLAFHEAIIHGGKRTWKRALFHLSVLPAEAVCTLDAILRTLWRLAFTHKHMMDWVPAADADGSRGDVRLPGRIAALLLLPGLLRPFWAPAALALAALFWVGSAWAQDLARTDVSHRGKLSPEQHAFLGDLARRTWKFFEAHVPMDGCGLPPDNVQLDPPVGIAARTSPTNIGLYLMSCLSAHELGFVNREEMLARMSGTVSTMEKLEKWNGHIYNWYDIHELAPLRPRYVSAVDSGNLAGALLLCAHAIYEMDAGLSRRMQTLAEEMNLAALYDQDRKLFFIGMDAETGRMSQSHYDLYGSESRILSFSAMMLGQVPAEHWKHLSRLGVQSGKNRALASWSGTMFEYLMPELLLRSPENTLAGQSRRGVVAIQIAQGKALSRPWGVSESGYYAFDLHLNYQYRAFGLRSLALSGNAVQDVVAPYASALALMVQPAAAAENLRIMCEMGWSGEFGMYEAADYMHTEDRHRPRIVRSCMAHHQGMALCAICNALRDDVLSRWFMEIPQAQALRLMLQEKETKTLRLHRRDDAPQMRTSQDRRGMDYRRSGRREDYAADGHLLYGGSVTALVTARGAAFAWKDGWQLNRFGGDLLNRHEGMVVHLFSPKTGRTAVIGDGGRAHFDAGCARFIQDFDGLRVEMTLTVSPENGTLYQQLQVRNDGKEDREIEVTGCLAVALAPEKDMRAHPVFQNLFVQSERMGESALVFSRRQREPGSSLPKLVYALVGGDGMAWETSMEKLIGRAGSLGMSGGILRTLTGTTGDVLNPCAALRTRMTVEAGKTTGLHFALSMTAEDRLQECIRNICKSDAPERALQLSSTQMRVMIGYAGIDAAQFRLLERASVLIFDPRLRGSVREGGEACPPMKRGDLWKEGISGDLPILLVEIGDDTGLDCVRDVIRMHAFYRMMGVRLDLVILDNHANDYIRPVQGSLGDIIASSHLNGHSGETGGVFVLERQNMDEASLAAILRTAALRFNAAQDGFAQLRIMLDGLHLAQGTDYAPMRPGEPVFPTELRCFNGYGGFDGSDYAILLRDSMLPPAPWSNVIASERAGAIVTERGGGFAWFGNSRSDRLTPFANDALREGWGWMFYLIDESGESWMRLLPGDVPMADFCVRHGPGVSKWSSAAGDIAFDVELRAEQTGIRFEITLRNEGNTARHLRLAGLVDWLMGTDVQDTAMLRTWSRFGGCFASGTAQGVGCFLADDPQARGGCDRQSFYAGGDMMRPMGLDMLDYAQGGWVLHVPMSLHAGEVRRCRFLLGCAGDVAQAYQLAREFRSGEALRRSREDWPARLEKLRIETPDEKLNLLANGFLQAQTLNARIRGRTGLYQPGGAYGFRDQLQDMLPMIHYEPERVRRHLLHCAARQFEAGDVLHWWHEPYAGVRTRISDDLLFLPYVAAQYVRITGDAAVLQDSAPFLKDIEIPQGREDIYAEMQPTPHCASLHEHCMRALRRAAQTGEHGLCRMGTGDWNDGMNRVGAEGRGESIWLSEFLAVCAADYARIALDEDDRAWLTALNERLCTALEEHGWDGEWYLRAYADDGQKLGGHACRCCRIDVISQAWAVLAGLDAQRTRTAMDAAWNELADEELGVIKLLAPPFDGREFDPGYIAAYPGGVRENGAQYTHAACWMLAALVRQGDAERAHRVLEMLLPVNHALTKADADIYRVEPYVMAADIYTQDMHAGRGGWTWYTGSAAWMLTAILMLLGFERRKNRVRLNALLGDWPEASITLRFGLSSYRLISRAGMDHVELDGERMEGGFIDMIDDGREHTALFPPAEKMRYTDEKIDIFKCIYT